MTDTTDLPYFPLARTDPFDPPPEYRSLREAEPITRVRIWNGTTPWMVLRYADQRAVLIDPRFSANSDLPGFPTQSPAYAEARRQGGRNFLTMDSPEHDVYRRMLSKDFSLAAARQSRGLIQEVVDKTLAEMLAKGPPADLVREFALPVPLQVICEILGVPYADRAFFEEHTDRLMSQAPIGEGNPAQPLVDYFHELIAERERARGDDLVSRLLPFVERGEITRKQYASTLTLLLVAGHETTANTIALGVLLLLEHPEQAARLRDTDDPELVERAVDELLRFLNVTHSGRRRMALEDVEIGGQLIRAGEGVIVPNDSGNRDPLAFEHPDEVDFDRTSPRHLTFGYGVHQCLGQHLSRVELEVAYTTLLRNVPTLATTRPLAEQAFKQGTTVYGLHAFEVAW